jgi:cytochrome c oxidase cbb3-type subunit 2
MKNGFFLFLGLFAALTISWAGLVLGSHGQLGSLAPYYDDNEGQAFPARMSGIAARGQLVYADLGCAACHTQQVRRPGFGSDQARGWGDRQSVARDYIFQARPQLGASRFGPDLTNLAGRKPSAPDAEDLLKLLYAGSELHPRYKFLFEERKIVGEPSARALTLMGSLAPEPGHEVLPSERAQSLVTYLLSLNNTYDYPESHPAAAPAAPAAAPAGEGHHAPEGEKK